jgi:aspartate racemase
MAGLKMAAWHLGTRMKLIGLIGGMSWESTVPYYRLINQAVKARLGGLHSARLILFSVDFHDIERLQHVGDWQAAGEVLAGAAGALEAAGADFLILCTNTMHKVAPAIQAAVRIGFIHIADPTASQIKQAGFSKVALLGTRFTMEEDFYRDRLTRQHGLEVVIPGPADRALIHRVIYEELCLGQINPASRLEFRRIIAQMVAQGAQAVILGCTEISLLVTAQDSQVPLLDTTSIHAQAAVDLALSTQ